MAESIVVYIGLMFIMMIFSWCGGYAKKYKLFWAALASLSFAFIMGIRYNVGTDFPTYFNIYEQACFGNYTDRIERWEIGFRLIMISFAKADWHYSFPFGLIAFIQIFLIYAALKHFYRIWIFIPITLILSCIWISYDNIMRHMLAFSIFVYSLQYLANNEYLKYLFCIIIAFLFHNSAVILIVFIVPYVLKDYYFSHIWIELLLLLGAVLMMNVNAVQEVFESISFAIEMAGYEDYMTTSFVEFNDESKMGLGILVLIVISGFIVINSNRMKHYYNNRLINIIYDFYFIGVLLRFAFARMFLMQRLNYYFYSFEFIIGAFMLAYFINQKKYISYFSLLGLYFIVFIGKMMQAEELEMAYKTFLSR